MFERQIRGIGIYSKKILLRNLFLGNIWDLFSYFFCGDTFLNCDKRILLKEKIRIDRGVRKNGIAHAHIHRFRGIGGDSSGVGGADVGGDSSDVGGAGAGSDRFMLVVLMPALVTGWWSWYQ